MWEMERAQTDEANEQTGKNDFWFITHVKCCMNCNHCDTKNMEFKDKDKRTPLSPYLCCDVFNDDVPWHMQCEYWEDIGGKEENVAYRFIKTEE